MAQYFIDFADLPEGEIPSGDPEFPVRWGTMGRSVEVIPEIERKALRYDGGSSFSRHATEWSASGTVTDASIRTEIWALWVTSDTTREPIAQVVLRGSGTQSARTGYTLWIRDYNGITLNRTVSGSDTAVASVQKSLTGASGRLHVEFSIQGQDLEARVWRIEDPRPALPDITYTDTNQPPALTTGWAGFGVLGENSNSDVIYNTFGIGTDGDLAPTAPVEATDPPSILADTAGAIDAWHVTCHIRTTFVAGITAADLGTDGIQAATAVESSAIADDLTHAIAQASAAIVDGAAADEEWVTMVQARATVQADAGAADSWVRDEIVEGAEQFESTSQAAAQFMAAVRAVQSLTHAATASEAMRATVRVILGLSEGATAADHWQATERKMIHHLSAAVDLQAVFSISASVGATLTSTATASAWFTTGTHKIQYLVLSAIRVTAALTSDVHIKPGY